jgi:threonine aldolase
MHLVSKMRFISAQFTAFFKNDLWQQNARHANNMARLLTQKLECVPACPITQKVESNAVFVEIPPDIVKDLQDRYSFNIIDSGNSIVRLMTSFDTTEEDLDGFVAALQELITKKV